MKTQYPGHAKRVMFGVWSFLRQFMYTKFVIVVDDDVDARNWQDVIWAITRMDPARDMTLIDYLDFASPVSGMGSKAGFDATNKWPETTREWACPSSWMPKSDTGWMPLDGTGDPKRARTWVQARRNVGFMVSGQFINDGSGLASCYHEHLLMIALSMD